MKIMTNPIAGIIYILIFFGILWRMTRVSKKRDAPLPRPIEALTKGIAVVAGIGLLLLIVFEIMVVVQKIKGN